VQIAVTPAEANWQATLAAFQSIHFHNAGATGPDAEVGRENQ
jgi:hypothetical protein